MLVYYFIMLFILIAYPIDIFANQRVDSIVLSILTEADLLRMGVSVPESKTILSHKGELSAASGVRRC